MITFKQRLNVLVPATIVAVVCGTLCGYLLARTITVTVTKARLEQYAARLVADGDSSSAELRTMLAAASASKPKQGPCSNADIEYFRALIFESEFLKDVGRMGNKKIDCSAALGRPEKVIAASAPDWVQQDGTKVYRNLSQYKNSSLDVITLQQGEFFVVFTLYPRLHLEPAPMHYFETVTDSPTQQTGVLLSDQFPTPLPIFLVEDQGRVGGNLYATRCSIRYFNCVTAYASIPDVIAVNRTKFYGCIALGALFGAILGVIFSFLYGRNKSLEQQLRRAIRNDGLRVAYQPIVDLTTRRIVGAEALVRWNDEEGVAVGPDVFVKIAEQRGFAGEITRIVARHVLRDFGETMRTHSGFRISINVAAADLSDPEFLPFLDRSLYKTGISPESLTIEITEGSTATHEVAIETIHSLRRRGHRVHIDDVGTGYSSLSYLHELSVDAIKIDRSFTQAIGTESVVVAILPQILAMAKALDLNVIVEGIETDLQAEYFTGGDQPVFAQGWLFGRPVPASEFLKKMREIEKTEPDLAATY